MRLPCAALLLALLALAHPAAGQRSPHRVTRPPESAARPLHERLALADAALLATVDRVELGRIRLRDVKTAFGAPDAGADGLELKRAPSRPPPLAEGDRAVLLLRGARSPYLLVDRGAEIPRPEDEAEGQRWLELLRGAHAALDEPDALLLLYLRALEEPSDALRNAALIGIGDPDAAFHPVPSHGLAWMSAMALDPAHDSRLRRVATVATCRFEEGRRLLLPALPGDAQTAHPEVLLVALRSAVTSRDPELVPLMQRALRHERADIRRGALRLAAFAAKSEALRADLERLAEDDPDAAVRSTARRALR